ncbi:mg2+ transporter- family : MgtC family transporter protein OS=Candidatus Symbiobacter mobilis CR GN=Cenrod_0942 PE=4 SV=1: MgtC [Gemmata massiliana]|uniref:MgtC/SapB/SrpB/YhiD N-terminal domain-containing protein n=1 Tax=Gemmata massiliana TaxID=1210884 RepID=A0A6P2CTZ1_9BACT|nr:MgtC/SapB family protein [Gemmata massiliana]VTR91615.1 mg2+ transporter- family : MgtC family transporter protein OS=Candidatus Symbiobacter mobilis CR GN=Cenrod_0942 PE=4 SV=1: MgtC [Gemmata massiliana]
MGAIVDGVVTEFSDLSAVQAVQLALRLVIAAVLGGLIGRDREKAGKAAGVRTHLLVSVGAAAFVAVPQQSGATAADVTRILQGLVAGIGFLGAGCIWKDDTEGRVEGLTTAAGLWLTAAVGAAAGMGRELSALLVGLTGLFALSVLGHGHNAPVPQDKNRSARE